MLALLPRRGFCLATFFRAVPAAILYGRHLLLRRKALVPERRRARIELSGKRGSTQTQREGKKEVKAGDMDSLK